MSRVLLVPLLCAAACTGSNPEVSNGIFTCSGKKTDEICTAECNEGYWAGQAAPTSTCLATGFFGDVTGSCVAERKLHSSLLLYNCLLAHVL
jgi:hypothetical protein